MRGDVKSFIREEGEEKKEIISRRFIDWKYRREKGN
jgi:hypothetical protein